jgi:hypothetical protein
MLAGRRRLARIIALTLAVKAAGLLAIHELWFSKPEGGRLTSEGVAAVIVNDVKEGSHAGP